MDLYIITGASAGLGKAITELALREGHQVIAIARSFIPKQDRLQSIQQDLGEFKKLPSLVRLLFSQHEIKKFNSIHLINNAGIIEPIDLSQNLNATSVAKNIEINLIAPMIFTNSFLSYTRNFQGWRTIVNISSGVAEKPKASWSAYSAAKGGLRIYSHSLAQEFVGLEKTRILCFNPGIMDTQMQAVIRNQSEDRFKEVEKFKAFKTEGKLLAPEAVAKALVDLIKIPASFPKIDINILELL